MTHDEPQNEESKVQVYIKPRGLAHGSAVKCSLLVSCLYSSVFSEREK